jgi:hypothetical protein
MEEDEHGEMVQRCRHVGKNVGHCKSEARNSC